MYRKSKKIIVGLAVGAFCLVSAFGYGAEEKKGENKAVKHQKTCPIMGGAINRKLFVDHKGKRIYVCCQGCIGVVKKNPEKYIKVLEAKGITLDKTPVKLCTKCGEVKGSDKCCKIQGREKCKKCGLLKGSPGCCKIGKDVKDATVCRKCGQVKGTGKCCKIEGREKCGKCGLGKGSPGCCKLSKANEKAKDAGKACKAVKAVKDAKKNADKAAGAAIGCYGGCGGGAK